MLEEHFQTGSQYPHGSHVDKNLPGSTAIEAKQNRKHLTEKSIRTVSNNLAQFAGNARMTLPAESCALLLWGRLRHEQDTWRPEGWQMKHQDAASIQSHPPVDHVAGSSACKMSCARVKGNLSRAHLLDVKPRKLVRKHQKIPSFQTGLAIKERTVLAASRTPLPNGISRTHR